MAGPTPGPGEVIEFELYHPLGGGLRANLQSLDTSLNGARETLRSYWRDYAGSAGGSAIREISMDEFVDGLFFDGGFDPETAYLNNTSLYYRMTMTVSGRTADGYCHFTKVDYKWSDGKATGFTGTLEGDPTPFA